MIFPLFLHLGQRFFDDFVLFLVIFLVENDGAILSACIIPLAIESSWIMNVHENVKESLLTYYLLLYWMTLGSK